MDYLHHSAPIAEALSSPRLDSVVKLVKDFDNLKLLGENFADKEENTMHREDDGRILSMSQDKNYSHKQRVLDIVNGENATLSKAKKRAAETATLSETSDAPLTVVSTADGAKVLNNLDKLAKDYDNLTTNNRKSFLKMKQARPQNVAMTYEKAKKILQSGKVIWERPGQK